MKTFLLDILPKIQNFSQKLDDISLLTNQHWVLMGSIGSDKTIYIFRLNNELLVSTNGKVTKGKWEYLGNNSILVDINDESYLFKHGFFDSTVLALKADNSEEYTVFVNENKFEGELNSINKLLKFLETKYLDNPIISKGTPFITEIPTSERLEKPNDWDLFWSIKGRLRRKDYFIRIVFLIIPIILFLSIFGDSSSDGTYLIGYTLLIGTYLIIILQSIKRLQDINMSGWYCLVLLIPIINLFFLIYLIFARGNTGRNQYAKD